MLRLVENKKIVPFLQYAGTLEEKFSNCESVLYKILRNSQTLSKTEILRKIKDCIELNKHIETRNEA